MLLPPSVDEYVSATHRVRVIVEVVERLDLSRVVVGSADTGRGAFRPAGLVALLLYSFSIGVFSAREMARRLETDCALLFATSGQRPSYRTIARFRTDEAEALAGIFAQVLVVCWNVGLGSLDVVAIDGTRVRSLDAQSRRSQLEKELPRPRSTLRGRWPNPLASMRPKMRLWPVPSGRCRWHSRIESGASPRSSVRSRR